MKENLQQKYLELQAHQQEIQRLEQNIENLEQQRMEMINTVNSMKEISEIKEERKFLTPLSQGIFIESKLDKAEEVLVNVGSGVIVRKTIQQAMDLIVNQLKEIDSLLIEFQAKLEQETKSFGELESGVQKLIEKEQEDV